MGRRITVMVFITLGISVSGCDGQAGGSLEGYAAKNFVVFTSAGHDIVDAALPEASTLEGCGGACDRHAECVGFSREKAASADEISACWFKAALPELDRNYGNRVYQTWMRDSYAERYEMPK